VDKALILGDKGLLGQALLQLDPGLQVIKGGRAGLDLSGDFAGIKNALQSARPAAVCINCIAVSNVDLCQRQPDIACAVNARGPGFLALACKQMGLRFIHISSDYVFDGSQNIPYREEDQTRPLSIYGESKRQGELRTLEHNPDALVVRTSSLFGSGRPSFMERPWQRYRAGQKVRAAEDVVSCPTWAPDLAAALLKLAKMKVKGILHVAGSGQASRLELAREFFAQMGLDPALVEAAKASDFAQDALRPAYSALDSSKAGYYLGGALPPWPQALRRHLRALGLRA
jgi:dTDP-4-dehydrorhamnose reductase